MGVLISLVVTIIAIPIIRSLKQLENNTREIINKASKFEQYIEAIKKIN